VAGPSVRAGEPLRAEDQSQWQSRASGIALIDIGAVYENSRKFQRDMEELKLYGNVHGPSFRNEYQRHQRQMDQILVELVKHEKGSMEYERLRSEWLELHRQSIFAYPIQLPKTNKVEFMRREARVYYDSYQDICDAVRAYAETHQIGLVLRFKREPIDRHNANSIMKGVDRNTVFHTLPDITDDIIRRINERDAERHPDNETPPDPMILE
jgi:hypothetical protein